MAKRPRGYVFLPAYTCKKTGKRKQSSVWWIGYMEDGKKVRRSSKSRIKRVAERKLEIALAAREGKGGTSTHPNEEAIVTAGLKAARKRAKRDGVPFALTPETVPSVPSFCPVFGIEMKRSLGSRGGSAESPSLDRVCPNKGYVPNNVQWVSYRANSMKRDASPRELLRFADWIYRTLWLEAKDGVSTPGLSEVPEAA